MDPTGGPRRSQGDVRMARDGKVRVGIIGSQFQADIHAASLQIMPDEAEAVAIASPTPGNAAALAKRFGIPRVFHRLPREVERKRYRAGHHRCSEQPSLPNGKGYRGCRQTHCLRKASGHDDCRRRRNDRGSPEPRRSADVRRGASLHAEVLKSERNGRCRRVRKNLPDQTKRKTFRTAQ